MRSLDSPLTPVQCAAHAFMEQRHGLLAFLHYLLRDPHTAEDLFQEVWVRLAGEIERGSAIENVPGWCRTVARHLVSDHFRAQSRARVHADSELVALLGEIEQVVAEDESDAGAWAAHQQALRGCLTRLPERSRTLLTLRYERGLTVEGIAAALALSAHAIGKALYRLRRALAQCVDRQLRLQEIRP